MGMPETAIQIALSPEEAALETAFAGRPRQEVDFWMNCVGAPLVLMEKQTLTVRYANSNAAVLFGLGLFLDLFWGNVLGLWPLCLMGVYAVVLLSRNLLAGQQMLFLFAGYVGCVLAAFGVAYLIVTMRAANAPSLLSFAGQVIPTLILFPIAAWMLDRFDDGDVRFR